MSKKRKSIREAVAALPDHYIERNPSWLGKLKGSHPELAEDILSLAEGLHDEDKSLKRKFPNWSAFTTYVIEYLKEEGIPTVSKDTMRRSLKEEICLRKNQSKTK